MPAARFATLAALAAAVLAASLAAAAPAPLPIAVDPLPLRALLAARDFAGLEARVAVARATRDSHELTALLLAVGDLAPGQHAGLEAWTSERPDSLPARLALAQRELARAWEARGTGAASTVGGDARGSMRAHLERALALAGEVADRDPSWLDARRIQIECAQLLGDSALARRAFDAALAVDATHYGVWSRYQRLFLRRWGGSYEAQEQIARHAQAHVDANPRLRKLLGNAAADRGFDLWSAGRHADALAAYDRALQHGDDGWLRADRAALRAAMGDGAGARAEIERGLAIDPYLAKLHAASARLCMPARDFACTSSAAARAVELEPSSREFRELQTWAAWAVENRNVAIRQLERHPVQEWLHRNGRWFYFHALESAVVAALAGIGWYAYRAWRRRRAIADVAAAAHTRIPDLPRGARPSMVERLPRSGVLMLRAFLWFLVVRHGLYYSESLRPGTDHGVLGVDVAITLVAFAGALCFAHGIRLGRAWIWKLWAPLFPIWNQVLWIHFQGFTWEQWTIWSFDHLTFMPVYTTLWLYGYACNALWAGGLPGPGWASVRRTSRSPARTKA